MYKINRCYFIIILIRNFDLKKWICENLLQLHMINFDYFLLTSFNNNCTHEQHKHIQTQIHPQYIYIHTQIHQ
jgi:hypothetical protein